jgi:hypothetical protein
MLRFLALPTILLALGATVVTKAHATSDDDEDKSPAQVSKGIELPRWEQGEFRDSFDIRIWPEATAVWLEQQNLRDRIADTTLPEEEREYLKQVLAQQLGVPVSS